MLSLRITAPDGSVRAVPLQGPELSIGRAPDNTLVLDGSGVSSHHCTFVVQGTHCVLYDRGSTNGTYVNNERIQQSSPLGDADRIYVGQYLLQVLHGGSGVSAHPITAPHGLPAVTGHGGHGGPGGPGGAMGGRILIQREDRAWRDQYNRLMRYAEQWDEAGRPDRLALRPKELRRARQWLRQTPPHQQEAISALQRELITFSGGANTRMAAKRFGVLAVIVLVLGGLVTGAVLLWPEGDPDGADDAGDTADSGESALAGLEEPRSPEPVPDIDPSPRKKIKKQIAHTLIPEETLDDIANRYGVSVADLAEWNLLNPDDPGLEPGDVVKIKKPQQRPLPQQRIKYELEREDTSWTKLSKRFGVSAKKLRAYNPDVKKLRRGQEVVIWIDPKPYKPREPRQAIPEYVPDRTALSIGSPNSGSLENGIQLPDSPLYKRRYPYIMWGSGYLIANVQKAVAQFRNDMDFDGTLVMADISKRNGGYFYPPHKSHQAGRDIDIWLPTLRGVFKEKYLNDEGDEKWGRRPNPEEVDWFATWGLIAALLDTDAVQAIFLSDSVQPSVYDAAKYLGVSDDELDYALQYPKGQGKLFGIVSHSPGHSHHMHVRFKCAPYEKRCSRHNVRGE